MRVTVTRDLAPARAAAIAAINAGAAAALAGTRTAGLDVTYAAKRGEAERIGDGAACPLLEAEAAATGRTVDAVAATVLAAAARCDAAAIRIETARQTALAAVRAAPHEAAIAAAADIKWEDI